MPFINLCCSAVHWWVQLHGVGGAGAAGFGVDSCGASPDEKLAKAELAEAIDLYVKVALGLVEG